MRTCIYFAIIAMICAPAWADLNWNESIVWTAPVVGDALTAVGADYDVRSRLDNYYLTDRQMNAAQAGALFAAALQTDDHVSAVDQGYRFMQALIAEQNKLNASVDTDVAVARGKLKSALDAECDGFDQAVGATAADSVLTCVRNADDNGFDCVYSRKYTVGGLSYTCINRPTPFPAYLYKSGDFINGAVLAMVNAANSDTKPKQEDNKTASNDNRTPITDVATAERTFGTRCKDKCDDMMAMRYGRNSNVHYTHQKSEVRCTKRAGTDGAFDCRCQNLYNTNVQSQDTMFCSTSFNGTVVRNGTSIDLNGNVGDVKLTNNGMLTDTLIQPMAQINPSKPELIPAHEKTKKEIRQETREINKQLREIERAEKAEQKAAKKAAKTAPADDAGAPAYVAPMTDGTDVDINPTVQMDEFMDELMSVEPAPTKKEQRAAAREARKQERQENRQNRKNPAPTPTDAPATVSLGVDVPIDNLGDLDPALLGPEYVSEVRYYQQ